MLEDKVVVEIIALVLTIIGMVGAFIFALFRVRDGLNENLAKEIKGLRGDIAAARMHSDEEFQRVRRETGEAYAALRAKAYEIEKELARVEKEALEKFVRRDSFSDTMRRMEQMVEQNLKRIDENMKDIHRKVDSILLHKKGTGT